MSAIASSAAPPIVAPLPTVAKRARNRRTRILLVTPELSESRFLGRNGKRSPCVKAGGLADVSALLLDTLSDAGADVHVAIPHYRSLIHIAPGGHSRKLHLCNDREFFYRRSVYDGGAGCNLRAALAFQRDVIHYVMPRIRPDVVHCHDWMTGLVPAAARAMGIPSIFTLHNLHDEEVAVAEIEDRGIDVRGLWRHLYFKNFPPSYEASREGNPVSLLASGIMSADETNTVSPAFLGELADGVHGSAEVGSAIRAKIGEGRAHGILNSLPNALQPIHDPNLAARYDFSSHREGKRANKLALQRVCGLEEDPDAPLIFWPSRLEPHQKGCRLLAAILQRTVVDYWGLGLQFIFVADGPDRGNLESAVAARGLEKRVAFRDFNERESRLGYAASDFTLIPSCFEPCGLAQMIGLRYGSLPIVHATGGLRDTVTPLDRGGNGIVFEHHNSDGLRWAIDEAMRFHMQPDRERIGHIAAIMERAAAAFQPAAMIDRYLDLYDRVLNRL